MLQCGDLPFLNVGDEELAIAKDFGIEIWHRKLNLKPIYKKD